MKIGICISNETPIIKGKFNGFLQQKVNQSTKDWSLRFSEALNKKNVNFGYIYIDRDDWIQQIKQYDILLWKPKFMGIESSQFFKEKIYFIQHIMDKRIYPNYETVWHFDSKNAQKYLFEYTNIKTPKTFVSFDYNESIKTSNKIKYLIVVKSSNGAGSIGVKLVKSYKTLTRKINFDFLGKKILNRLFNTNHDPFGYLYFQTFMENNDGDLRINIIGDKYAVGFWRSNRDNDFRASGSGKIDYNKEIPVEIIEYCANISKINKFDSMAYDVLFDQEGDFVIVEMSYGFIDTAVYNAKGYYLMNSEGKVSKFIAGNYWPQELWVEWALENINNNEKL